MKENTTIKEQVYNVVGRICLFVLYYILLISLGIFIIWGVFKATPYVLSFIFDITSGHGALFIGICWIGICLFALMFGLYLVKPLFSFTRNKDERRVEVTEAECPQLFAEIRDLARQVGTQMPKHVYLMPTVKACVFYNTSFWSIFFPVRKNLEIGLGLFDDMSVDEVKSVLAHEFGHFSQKSMKVGASVSIVNTVLNNLIFEEDFWDRLVDKWANSGFALWSLFGILTRWLANQVKRLTYLFYKMVQRSYMKLSRQKEYDADGIACNCLGSDTFISAMCKVKVLSNRETEFYRILDSLVEEDKMVENYLTVRYQSNTLFPDSMHIDLSYDKPLTSPVTDGQERSKLKIDNPWASHPSMEDRLQNAAHFPSKHNSAPRKAWDLIPDQVAARISQKFVDVIVKGYEDTELKLISNKEFLSWLEEHIKTKFIPTMIRPFFNHYFCSFDIENIRKEEDVENPFTKENFEFLSQNDADNSDYNKMKDIINGELDADYINYDGVVYSDKNLPLKELEEKLDKNREVYQKIDVQVYRFLLSKCDDEETATLKNLYHALSSVQKKLEGELEEFSSSADEMWEEINKTDFNDDSAVENLSFSVQEFEMQMQKLIKSANRNYLLLAGDNDTLQRLDDFSKLTLLVPEKLDSDFIDGMFQIVNDILYIHYAVKDNALDGVRRIARKYYKN